MCCCLSTLRRFSKHFAPRLIGESSSTGNNKTRFSNNVQRTFGGGGTKRTRDTFKANNDTSGIPLSSFDDLDKRDRSMATKTTRLDRDDDSEEAILFERSVQVTYEDAGQNGGDSARSHQPKIWTESRV
jgi:hypothetical protein